VQNESFTSGSSPSSRRATVAIAVLVTLVGAHAAAQRSTPASHPYDTIIRHGIVADGSGLPPYFADVAIRGDYIARIGDLSKETAPREISAWGMIVAPGFINIHSHASPAALGEAFNMLTQGVTTEILNADGGGPVDLTTQPARFAAGLGVNVGGYIGFNSIWSSVVGADDRRPTTEEIERMRALVVKGMEAGAWGVSAGLDYKPAYFATTDEVIRVVSAAAPWRTNFTNHDRVTPETKFSSRAGISETLKIAERTGLLGVVTHMKVTGRERGTAAASLKLIADSTRRGHYAAADVYPYLAGQTGLGALLLPAWALDGGRDALQKRLADPEQRARIVAETEQIMQDRFGGEGVFLPAMKRELSDIQREMNVSAGEAIARLLEQSNQPSAIIRFGLEEDLRKILQSPNVSIACDCGATTSTATHPRNYGTYPRVLGHYVREQKVLTWQEAIRKMTALPAATIGLYDRGYLAPGMKADIVVFDPMVVIDHATYESPAEISAGVRYLFVNGERSINHGIVGGGARGRLLRRGEDGVRAPSRPMSRLLRGLAFRATSGDFTLSVDVAQSASERRARGLFRVLAPGTRARTPATDIGVLQVAPDWATVSTADYRLVVQRSENRGEAEVILFSLGDGGIHRFSLPWRNVRITGARNGVPAASPPRGR
jgi:N-acyl-D-amino-acid deacylase